MFSTTRHRALAATGSLLLAGGAAATPWRQLSTGGTHTGTNHEGCEFDYSLNPTANRATSTNVDCDTVYVRHYYVTSGGGGGFTSWKSGSVSATSTATAVIQYSQHYGQY